jgi:hypothetical protein
MSVSSSHSKYGATASVPVLNPHLAARVADWLQATYETRRRPDRQASVLAIILQLAFDKRGDPQPFPKRDDIAAYLGCSIFTVDAACYRAMERDLIRPLFLPVEGHAARGGGVNLLRYYEVIDDALKAQYVSVKRAMARRPSLRRS